MHEANDISRIVRLKQEVENLLGEASKHGRKLQVTIVGAEEAWVVRFNVIDRLQLSR